jgi:hypothetical protein
MSAPGFEGAFDVAGVAAELDQAGGGKDGRLPVIADENERPIVQLSVTPRRGCDAPFEHRAQRVVRAGDHAVTLARFLRPDVEDRPRRRARAPLQRG